MQLVTLIHKSLFGTLLLWIFCISTNVNAQTAEDYFHDGAQTFIGGNLPGALMQVQNGLLEYPGDPKLSELLQKLKEEEEEQQQQQNQDQQEQEEQQNQEQQENDQQQENENQEQQENEQQQDEQNNNQEEQEPQDQESKAQQAREISKEEAQKILQALAQKEKVLLKEFKKQKKQGSATHDKDW